MRSLIYGGLFAAVSLSSPPFISCTFVSAVTCAQPSTRVSLGQLWWQVLWLGGSGLVTKVKVTKGETPPVPKGSGVSNVDKNSRLGGNDRRDGRVQPSASQNDGDVEGFLANPSSSSREAVGTTAVSGLDTVVGQAGSGVGSEGSGPKVSIPMNDSDGRLVAPDPDSNGHTGNKRKRACRQLESLRHNGERHLYSQLQDLAADGASRVRMRRWLQWTRKQRKHKRRQKDKRTRAVLTQRKQEQKLSSKQCKANKRFKIVTWNTRGWGAVFSEFDQVIKTQCILDLLEQRGVGLGVLTDVKFRESGVREYTTHRQTWTVVVSGKVAFAMNGAWAAWWRQGQSKLVSSTPASGGEVRVAALEFPRVGWRRGLFVVGVYAPTSAAPHGERESLRRQTGEVLSRAPGSMLRVVLGDFNAELGLHHQGGWEDVLGPYGLPRRSPPGAEWLEWCRFNQFLDAASIFPQRVRGTWWHPRFGTEHVLDHVFFDRTSCK